MREEVEELIKEVDEMLPSGGCNLCKFRSHAMREHGLRDAYYRHRKDTGHDSFWQRKFYPVMSKNRWDKRYGTTPTFRCSREGCEWVSRARNKNMMIKALRGHSAETGHSRIVRIVGAETPLIKADEIILI